MSSSPTPYASPAPFEMSSAPESTAPSSPPATSDFDDSEMNTNFDEKSVEGDAAEEEEGAKRFARLEFLLQKSAIYSQILKQRMDEDTARREAEAAAREKRKGKSSKRQPAKGRGKRTRALVESDESDSDSGPSKRRKDAFGQPEPQNGQEPAFTQPALITGATLKPYQLEGLQWMVSLDQNGISGILADEMGLGKTLQTIAFNGYLREQNNTKPFLVVCPLSVLHNWADEYKRFAPKIPICMYHGSPAERAELRHTVMALPHEREVPQPSKKSKGKGKVSSSKKFSTSKSSGSRSKKSSRVEESGAEPEVEEVDEMASFPVVITTYEMIIRDRAYLEKYDWGYIVVDEGHRLKNLNCKLIKEIKKYTSAGRMLLTGTPLHNNLAELWSLLNFILPDIFNDVDSFQEWFNLPTMENNLGNERSTQLISSLHAILKPFLLRRLKADVAIDLPPKKEYVLYAPLSIQQRETYNHVLDGTLRSYLIGEEPSKGTLASPTKATAGADDDEDHDRPMRLRTRKGRKSYLVDGDDDEYFDMVENGEVGERGVRLKEKTQDQAELERLGREHQYKATLKQVNNMKLQNIVMQLRKVCSHPYLFDWPLDPVTRQPVLNEDLVNASGKMMVLDRLLRELFKRGHKVLLFSQFTTMLDLIEDWAVELMGWNICRIDGSTAPLERRQQMETFQSGGGSPNTPRLFLLSTRAGGLGINLTAADTVIFYDQDWNPQMDVQAQDRAHRIGQTKPVLIFRIVTAHTIETKIMQRATEKRKLEALVIAKGKFRMPAVAPAAPGTTAASRKETMAEMAASLLKLEGEKINVVPNTAEGKARVISDEDLDMLLDRSPGVFSDRGKGWTSTGQVDEKDVVGAVAKEETTAGKRAAFAVYEAPVDTSNHALASMLGEKSDLDVE